MIFDLNSMHSFGAKVNHLTGLEEQLITLVPERQFLCKTSPKENFKSLLESLSYFCTLMLTILF